MAGRVSPCSGHRIWELMAKRPSAIKYTGFFKELPVQLQDYLVKCDLTAKKAALQVLTKMVKSSDLATTTAAFTDTLKRGLNDPDSIWSNYIRLTSGSYETELTELPQKVPELSPYPQTHQSKSLQSLCQKI